MSWRSLLLPFNLPYSAIVRLRNWAFDAGILKATSFDLPIIALGNLSTGGTGKTPHTEAILRLLSDTKFVVLSRGYGRKSKGFLWVASDASADEVGDEPLQIKRKFQGIPVAVCEDRVLAIPQILAEYPDTEAILLDDAFQHRYLKAGTYILLTTWDKPYFSDKLLPAGNLREPKAGSKRADAVIVTKCPQFPNSLEVDKWNKHLGLEANQSLFFSKMQAGQAYHLNGTPLSESELASLQEKEAFTFSAIAGGSTWSKAYAPFFKSLKGELSYRDHHRFSIHDIKLLKSKVQPGQAVLTTEKDAMRLQPWLTELEGIDVIYFALEIAFSEEEQVKQFLLSRLNRQ